jgi:hypothetical protein
MVISWLFLEDLRMLVLLPIIKQNLTGRIKEVKGITSKKGK